VQFWPASFFFETGTPQLFLEFFSQLRVFAFLIVLLCLSRSLWFSVFASHIVISCRKSTKNKCAGKENPAHHLPAYLEPLAPFPD